MDGAVLPTSLMVFILWTDFLSNPCDDLNVFNFFLHLGVSVSALAGGNPQYSYILNTLDRPDRPRIWHFSTSIFYTFEHINQSFCFILTQPSLTLDSLSGLLDPNKDAICFCSKATEFGRRSPKYMDTYKIQKGHWTPLKCNEISTFFIP